MFAVAPCPCDCCKHSCGNGEQQHWLSAYWGKSSVATRTQGIADCLKFAAQVGCSSSQGLGTLAHIYLETMAYLVETAVRTCRFLA